MRLPFFRTKPEAEAANASRPRGERARSAAADPAAPADVALARTRARQRLVGALVLLAVGVVGFPLLFETQPRPLPVDIPIRMPAGDMAPAPAAAPALRPLPVTALPPDAGSEIALTDPAAAASAASAAAARPAVAVQPSLPASTPAVAVARASAPAAAASVKAVAPAPQRAAASAAAVAVRPSTNSNDGARAAALLSGAASAPVASGRFVVQVGAYTDARTLKEARGKVEKLGLQTYTQVVENDAGKRTRVRLGPYATRDEAEAAAAKLKRAGLPANILAL